MVLLQTTQRVNVVLHRAQQIQVCIVTSRATNVVLFHHALKPMALLQTTQRVYVARDHVVQALAYIAMQYLVCVARLALTPMVV